MTDEQLALLAQKGDHDAEINLLDKYRPLVKKHSRGYFLVGGDVEDLIQEGMIGLYKAIRNYSPEKNANFSSFASLCIRRQIQTAVRNASTRKNIMLSSAVPITCEDEDDYGVFLISSGPSPDQELISKQTSKALLEQIKALLSPNEYIVLKLYLAGLSYEQIASKTGQNKKSVDNALTRIKKKLSQIKTELP